MQLRSLRLALEELECQIQRLLEDKRRVEASLDQAREEATRLRRVKDSNDQEKRQLEQEIKSLDQLCDARQHANESLGRELQQMVEDDDIIR